MNLKNIVNIVFKSMLIYKHLALFMHSFFFYIISWLWVLTHLQGNHYVNELLKMIHLSNWSSSSRDDKTAKDDNKTFYTKDFQASHSSILYTITKVEKKRSFIWHKVFMLTIYHAYSTCCQQSMSKFPIFWGVTLGPISLPK